jgi:predicted lysophospholipase L1 biosynthesis ABC-type transport system permease subunit
MVEPGAAQITALIQSRHRPNSVYRAQTFTEILHDTGKIANILTWVLTLAAAITLIVAGVGIMNSMLANVQSRIREIGIRKALGATRREIRLQFLTEAVFLSLSGGIIGTLLGLAVPLSVRFLTVYKIPVGWQSAPIALATSVIVGVIFGTVPANRAARLDPVETLKYEGALLREHFAKQRASYSLALFLSRRLRRILRRIALHRHLQMARHLAVQLDRHIKLAQRLQRLFQRDLAPVDRIALLLQLVRNVARGYRAEQVVVLTHLALEHQFHGLQLLRELFRLDLLLRQLAHSRALHLLDHRLVR